jgi:hypothetical protein
MVKLSLSGLRNIPLAQDVEIEPEVDYLIPVIASRIAVRKPDPEGGEIQPTVYEMRVQRISDIQKVGSSSAIAVKSKSTPSQKLRLAILDMLGRTGADATEEGYAAYMERIIKQVNNINP